MSSSRRLAAAVSALAVVAGGLVSAVVISAGPAIADHCEPGEPPQQSQRQRGQDQDGNDQGQDPNGQDQNQDQNPDGQDQGDQNQNDQDGQDGQDGQNDQDDQDGQNGAGRQQDPQQDGDQPVSGGGALSQALDPVQNPDDQNQNPDGQDQGDQNQNQNRDRNQEQDPGQDQ
ncbi:MAG: hypothetical protein K0R62_6953, partial [Nonomuraea muscovyensis]|nr:hypothetical protein [Nonomuraea muscovyensis]